MKTIDCPACNTANPTTASVCGACGGSLTEALLQKQLQELKETTEQLSSVHKPTPVLRSFNGCGKTLLDYRPRPDGTFDATRWITLFYLPVFPLSTVIVRPIRRDAVIGSGAYTAEVLGEGKLVVTRVLLTYLLAVLAVGPMLFAFFQMDLVNQWVGSGRGFWVTLATIVWGGFLISRISNSDRAFR